MTQLRDYQKQIFHATMNHLQSGTKGVMIYCPTGGGKTVIFCEIAIQEAARGLRVGILVHRKELVWQTSDKLGDVPHGMIMSGVDGKWRPNIQIATIQTLASRLHKVKPFDLIIVDEAHHATTKSYQKILKANRKAKLIGVSATPCRTDGAPLSGAGFTKIVLGPSTKSLTEQGFLCPAKVYAPGGMDLTGVKKIAGDYSKRDLGVVAEKTRRTGCAVEHYRKYANKQPAIAFCVSLDDARQYAEQFRAAGYNSEMIDGTMGRDQRKALIDGLASGKIDVLTSCDLISEGLDVPVVSCGIMLRPTKSLALWIQQMGRVLRPATGKEYAIILDHSGNVFEHQTLPTTEHEWSLDGDSNPGQRKQGAPRLVTCPECQEVHESAANCPACGFHEPRTKPQIETQEGSLELVHDYKTKLSQGALRAVQVIEIWNGVTFGNYKDGLYQNVEKSLMAIGHLQSHIEKIWIDHALKSIDERDDLGTLDMWMHAWCFVTAHGRLNVSDTFFKECPMLHPHTMDELACIYTIRIKDTWGMFAMIKDPKSSPPKLVHSNEGMKVVDTFWDLKSMVDKKIGLRTCVSGETKNKLRDLM